MRHCHNGPAPELTFRHTSSNDRLGFRVCSNFAFKLFSHVSFESLSGLFSRLRPSDSPPSSSRNRKNILEKDSQNKPGQNLNRHLTTSKQCKNKNTFLTCKDFPPKICSARRYCPKSSSTTAGQQPCHFRNPLRPMPTPPKPPAPAPIQRPRPQAERKRLPAAPHRQQTICATGTCKKLEIFRPSLWHRIQIFPTFVDGNPLKGQEEPGNGHRRTPKAAHVCPPTELPAPPQGQTCTAQAVYESFIFVTLQPPKNSYYGKRKDFSL